MKKYLTLFVLAICVLLLVVGCTKDNSGNDEADTTLDFNMNSWNDEVPSDFSGDFPMDEQGNVIDPNNPNNTVIPDNPNNPNIPNVPSNPNTPNTPVTPTTPSGGGNSGGNSGSGNKIPSNPFISDEDISKLENSNAEVYYSDNPNNKYIVKVVNKYGSDPANLIALVKVNAQFPSGMVLEFSGKRDANGELVMTYNELKYVYNIDDSKNKLVRAGKSGGNDGVSAVESKITFALMKEYFIPQLPTLKATKRYD